MDHVPTYEELAARIRMLERERDELRSVQKALRDSERILSTTQRLARVGGWEWQVGSGTLTWTEETSRIHGFSPAEFADSATLLEASLACLDPEDRTRVEAAFQRCIEHAEPYDLEAAMTMRDGRRIHVRSTAEPVLAEGRVVKVVGNIMDVTEFETANRRVTESDDLLSNLARLVPGVIYQYRLFPDGSSAFPYSSPGMADIYEVTPEEVREDASPVFGRLHPEDVNRVAEDIFDSARTLETFHCEFRVVLPRQGLRWRLCLAHPERLPDGGTLWHGIITDITDSKLAELEKENLRNQLAQSQKMESVGRLAGGVAHDYNNMLSVIQGYTELVLEKIPEDNEIRKDLEIVLGAAQRSADLTRQLLAFSRRQTIAPRILDLNETVESMLKMLRRLIGEDIELAWRPDPGVWPVRIDPVQLDQLLVNFCVNARDAIGGVGRITIETSTRTFDQQYCDHHAGFVPGDFVCMTISDDGSGMDETTRDMIFEPFFTTKELGKGTGMGLATVLGIVKQNEGFINVYSELGVGTTFTIYLPRQRGRQVARAGLPEAAPRAQPGEMLLLVEDEQYILNMAAEMLGNLGYVVLKAGTPELALELANGHRDDLDLLVTDVVMPGMNGHELAGRAKEVVPGLRVLFMSGYTADVIADRGILYEGVHFVHKPFSQKELAVQVRKALDERD